MKRSLELSTAGVGPSEAPRTSSMGKWDFLAPRGALSEVTSSVLSHLFEVPPETQGG